MCLTFPGTGVKGVCKLLHGCWEMNPGLFKNKCS